MCFVVMLFPCPSFHRQIIGITGGRGSRVSMHALIEGIFGVFNELGVI